MTIIPPTPPPTTESPSVAVMTAAELAAIAKRLTTLKIEPAERRIVLDHLRETMQHVFDTALMVSFDLAEDGPRAEEARDVVHDTALVCASARNHFEASDTAIADLEFGQTPPSEAELDALIDSGQVPGPDGAYQTKAGRDALSQLRATLAERHGVTG
ncbi:hypothetical protein OG884_06255 [Streptosporangium sp. NBC_01755]|uniref:hypothetical protein n=1 Tax=Streptosporangium sp. NBC_01755 TaxID=2975949 RepID=UPI002DDC482A|nr:hypothetical protein [Streptosporangium sp. NBC_01755]WSD01530.1 hypothetical protein OG884_06255 [Streptosporangium sp. NBC_01755]